MNKRKGFAGVLAGLDKVTDLNDKPAASPAPPAATGEGVTGTTQMVSIGLIDRDPNQPRKHFDDDKLSEMAASLESEGQLQPISIRPNPDKPGHFLLNIGERRWRAAQLIGWTEIEAKIAEPKNLRISQLAENIQREDLSDVEVADGLAAIMAEGQITQGQLAKAVNKSNAWITDYLALRSAPAEFRLALEAKTVANVHVLAEAMRLYKQHPDKVTELVLGASPEAPVNQAAVRSLKAKLGSEDARPKAGKAKTDPAPTTPPAGDGNPPSDDKPEAVRVRIHVAEIDGDAVGVLVLQPAKADGVAVVKLEGTGGTLELPMKSLRIERIEYP